MANAYICRIRSDLGSSPYSSFQLTDLTPNSSQYSIYETPSRGFYDSDFDGTCDMSAYGQSGYVGAYADFLNGSKAGASATAAYWGIGPVWSNTGGDSVTQHKYTGLAAYLLDNVEKGGAGGSCLDADEAAEAAALILVRMEGGLSLALSDVDGALATAGGVGTELTTTGGSASSGSLAAVLQILSGAVYNLPSGSVVATPSGTFAASPAGAMQTTKYRAFYDTAELDESVSEGQLATYMASTYSLNGTTGAAVVVYTAAGALKS